MNWPRNVRELRKLAERLAVLHGDAVMWQAHFLDPEMLAPLVDEDTVETVEKPAKKRPKPDVETLSALLDEQDGSVTEVARHFGRSRKQVYRWMAEFGLDRGTGRQADS